MMLNSNLKLKNNNQRYFFVLGNNPALSSAELKNVLQLDLAQTVFVGQENLTNFFSQAGQTVLITEPVPLQTPEKLMSNLGGVIKLGVIQWQGETKSLSEEIKKQLEQLIKNNISQDKKFYFGFSVYGQQSWVKNKKFFNNLAMVIKKELKEQGVKSRWVVSQDPALSAVVVDKNKLISEQGIDWCFFFDQNKVYLGQTLAVQEFAEYGERDYGRPARDARSGMLPPKLAKIMINLAKSNLDYNNLTLADPFCGSGTVLQEAVLLGIKQVWGSDLSEVAVNDAIENLEWLKNKFNLATVWQIKVNDAAAVSKFLKTPVDLIVAEPYLGPPLQGGESSEFINQNITELSKLYLIVLAELKKVLKPDGAICMVWPVFTFGQSKKILPIDNEVKKLGFKFVNILAGCPIRFANLSSRQNIIYGRPEQKVLREVVVLKL